MWKYVLRRIERNPRAAVTWLRRLMATTNLLMLVLWLSLLTRLVSDDLRGGLMIFAALCIITSTVLEERITTQLLADAWSMVNSWEKALRITMLVCGLSVITINPGHMMLFLQLAYLAIWLLLVVYSLLDWHQHRRDISS